MTHLAEWYRTHLGIEVNEGAYATFQWRDAQQPEQVGSTVWALFPHDSDYFGPGNDRFMVNYRVEDLRGVLAQLKAEGVTVDERIEEYNNRRFGRLWNPEVTGSNSGSHHPELENAGE